MNIKLKLLKKKIRRGLKKSRAFAQGFLMRNRTKKHK